MSQNSRLSIFDLPIPFDDMRAIEVILRQEDLFCTSCPDLDVYSVGFYHSQAELHNVGATIVLDRNVCARVVELAEGRPATHDNRIAAAVMAFGQCANIKFEPALAVYEGIATKAKNGASQELALFRTADNMHPSNFADIALGKSSCIIIEPSPAKVHPEVISPQRLREYSYIYPAVLKIALLELVGGPMALRMRSFLDWSFDRWYMIAAATALAAMLFSPSPPGKALKDLRNSNRSLALEGVRNCAWDLTYITVWLELLRMQSDKNCLYSFCSRDKVLRRVAQHMLGGPNTETMLQGLLGTDVRDLYVQLVARQHEMGRAINQSGSRDAAYGLQITSTLEQQMQGLV